MAAKRKSPPLARRQSAWLMVATLAAALPLSSYLPPWLAAAAALLLAWRGLLLWREQALPPRWLLSGLALGSALAIALQFHTLFGRDPGVAMLVLFLALKLLETRTNRDAMAVVLLDYFLVLALFFYLQTMLAAAAMLTAVLLITAALINLNHERQAPTATLRLAALLLAQATPFMLLMFVLFPRVSGPLWGLPADASSAVSGLSDTMAPGSISRLSQSDAIAFRSKFTGTAPAQARLYWRGPVLTRFDGRVWRTPHRQSTGELPYRPGTGAATAYEITLEPHNRPWLFALDLPVGLPADALVTPEYQLIAKAPVRARQRYALRSDTALHAGLGDSPARLAEALALPPAVDPRARRLAADLRATAGSDTGVVAAMLDFLRRNGFVYTLEPPLLGEDSIDQFLFETRRGFCEHFAGSFVFVMRAAGIPARVVTGYQGGELNPVDGYLEIRQYDAHAWAEVWLSGVGWQRVDPTAAIAPSRVEVSLAAAAPAGEPLPLLIRPEFTWLRELRYRLDALSNGWNQWVLGYNPQRQRDLLRNLGMAAPDWQSMTAVLAALCGVLMLGLTLWVLRQQPARDPALAAWDRLSAKLRRHGLERRPGEGPRNYAQRLAAALPERGDEIGEIARLYEALRYGAGSEPAQLRELKRRVGAFTP